MTPFKKGLLIGALVGVVVTLTWLKVQIVQAFRGYDGRKRRRI